MITPARPIKWKVGELAQGHFLHIGMGKGVVATRLAKARIDGWLPTEVSPQESDE